MVIFTHIAALCFVKLYTRATKHKLVNTYEEYFSQSDNCVSFAVDLRQAVNVSRDWNQPIVVTCYIKYALVSN